MANKQNLFLKFPPTVFSLLYNNSFSPDNQFGDNKDEIFDVIQAVGQIHKLRQIALTKLVDAIRQINTDEEINPCYMIKNLFPTDSDENFHQRIYLYYIIGMYKEASNDLHLHTQLRFQSILNDIDEISYKSEALNQCEKIYNVVADYLNNSAQVSRRVKGSASMLAKSITTGNLKINEISGESTKFEWHLLPYDFLGVRVLFYKGTVQEKLNLTKKLFDKLSEMFFDVKIRDVLSPAFMFRGAIVGFIKKNELKYPFQIQIRDTYAQRYEILSYGNYKMNKIWQPFITEWVPQLQNDMIETELPSIVLSELNSL